MENTERVRVLKDSIRRLEEQRKYGLDIGLCNAIKWGSFKTCLITDFPEVMSQKPDKRSNDAYWFFLNQEGFEKRIEILNNAIKQIEQNEKN